MIRILSACLLLGLVLLAACQTGSEEIGTNLIPNTTLDLALIDTFEVRLSTVLLDTVPTSGNRSLLVGQRRDAKWGTTTAKAFFELGIGEGSSYGIQGDYSRYDSLVLTLKYQGTYGDTTQPQYLGLHVLTEAFDPTRTYYSPNALAYEPTPLASRSLRAIPQRDSTLRLRLPDAMGAELFRRIKAAELSDDDQFREFLKGFALVPGGTDAAAVLSLLPTLRLYYHENNLEKTAYSTAFGLQASQHFNQLLHDRRGTPLSPLLRPRQQVDSRASGQEAYFERGVGLRIKLEFPSLAQLREVPRFLSLNRVELDLNPVRRNARDNTPPPAALVLYRLNASNELGPLVVDASNQASAAAYTINTGAIEFEDRYRFDLTAYTTALLTNQVQNRGLLLDATSSDVGNTVERLILGNRQHPTDKVMLRVFYTTTSN